jgi:DNA-binding winged helix-turn-helix (wHTH) protein
VLGARQALGERADSNNAIRTVRGLGYQFVRPIKQVEQAAAATGEPAPSPSPATPSNTPVATPFLGRESVLASLVATLDEVLRGNSRCVLLTGSPGIGKTRTAE